VELNTLDGITATTAELNKLDGVTATTAQLNRVDVPAGTIAASKALIVTGDGSVDQVLTTNGAGTLAWATPIPVFGASFGYAGVENETTTTLSWMENLRMTTGSLTGGYQYLIAWYYEWRLDDLIRYHQVRIQLDDVTTIGGHYARTVETQNWHPCSGWAIHTPSSSGTINVDLDYGNSDNSEAYLRRARLYVHRVA